MPVPADPTVLPPTPGQPPAVVWRDWPAEHITEHVRTIMSGSVTDLEAAAPAAPRA